MAYWRAPSACRSRHDFAASITLATIAVPRRGRPRAAVTEWDRLALSGLAHYIPRAELQQTDEQNWPNHGIHLKTIPRVFTPKRCAWDRGGFKPQDLGRLRAFTLPGMCYNRRAVMLGIARLFAAVGLRRCKLIGRVCGYYMSCMDYY